jgi:hypothetical protein
MASSTVFQTSSRVITRERGVIPGCIPAGPDSHMAVDGLGRPWLEVAKRPYTIDAWLADLRATTLASRKMRGACEKCGEMPKPKSPQPHKRYCQCPTGQFKAEAA